MAGLQIAYHAVVSHLLSFPKGEAALVDTTGSFSPLRLRDVIAFRLQARLERERYQHSGYVYERMPDGEKTTEVILDEATSMLDRVRVMRVFDFAGVVEAVGEVAQMIEAAQLRAEENEGGTSSVRKDEIGDSEEELDEDEIPPDKETSSGNMNIDGEVGRVGMLIVDTISAAVGQVMSKSQIQGQALLTSFMRSLHHLTGRHCLCTILINAAVGINPSKNPEYQGRPEEHVSIFSSTLGKPALGKTFTHPIDSSIFLSAVPKTSEDATIACADGESFFQKAFVVEVLKDKRGSREGRWAAFEIADGVKITLFRS